MRRAYQLAGAVFLGLGLYVIFQARRMDYFTPLGPGPGFFPFWLGIFMALLAVLWLARVTLGSAESAPPGFVPDRRGTARLLAVVGALAAFTWLVDRIGYSLAMLPFAFALLAGLGRHHWVLSLAISLAGSFGLYYVFRYWLGVQLPPSAVGLLADLGF